MEINAVILAAGLSSRMKAFKPLLKLIDKTMIEHSVDCMLRAGVNQIVIVLGYRAKEVEELLSKNYEPTRVTFVHNQRYIETDMLTSVKTGISALKDCDAFYILPGDMPAIRTSTFLAVEEAMSRTNAIVAFPAMEGHRQHPPLISWECKDLILKFDGDGGLRELWKQLENQIITVPVYDPGCLMDADTMEDYDKLKQYMEGRYHMETISKSVKKKDHDPKISGRALYVDDLVMDGMLFGRLLRSTKAKARITDIIIPELPEGYYVVDKNDITGINQVHIVLDDTPVYADNAVEFIGDPILMVVGPDLKEVEKILNAISVIYEEQVPVLDMREADNFFFNYNYEKGDIDKVMEEADFIFNETFQTGYQEQAYLETQGMIAYPHEDRMTVRGSLQCPYYVHGAVAKALGYEAKDVQIIQDVTGGGFGGKEAFPSILACQTAVAAKKANKPVKVIFDRREDMEYTSKRHPSICTYKVAMKDGQITGMDIDVLFNGGAYTTLSAVVLQRGLIAASGVYRIDNLRVRGRAVKTNSVPCGAFRGFGAPQTFFAVELMMNHIAEKIGVDSLELKEKYIVRQGDATSTSGKYHFHVPLPEMIQKLDELSNCRTKHKLYKNQTGRYRKGIGMSLFFHGCGFTGSGERDLIKAVVRIRKNSDDTVEVLVSNADIGQGLKTTFCKIVADTLGINYDSVFIENPDTDRVPDSGPTVASRSLMTVGGLLKRAAEKLKKEWKSGDEQQVEERFVQPEFVIPFSLDEFKGDAYPTYSWGVNAMEVEVDTLTATTKVIGAWGIYDVGVPVDMNIIQGQMQGGLLQGIGYSSMEQMDYNEKGRIRNNSFSDYIIPTAVDVPNLVTEIINNPYSHGPYGAKGAGELPLVGAAPAYVEAMENALGVNLNKAPFTQEDTMNVLKELF